MSRSNITSKTLSEMKDQYIGKKGTQRRNLFELELRMDVLGRMIRAARLERQLTQAQLGEMVGVQKAQISKLESSINSATIDTVVRVFKAMNAEIHFQVKMDKKVVQI